MTPSYKGLMNTNPLDLLLLVLSEDLANHSRDSVPLKSKHHIRVHDQPRFQISLFLGRKFLSGSYV